MAILNQLRTETADAHVRLEAAVDIDECLRDLSRYRALLEKFYGFYRSLEPRLEQVDGWDRWGLDPLSRRKVQWLEADLQALDLSQDELASLPVCEDVPEVKDMRQAFGCGYVIEGSTLGGRHISHLMQGSIIPEEARRFFRGYEGEIGGKWKEFCTALEGFAESGADNDEIVHSAAATFSCMQRWICLGERAI